jgi:L-amino acid N-acyltransferase YncA
MEPELRRAAPSDARAIAEVHVAAWRSAYRSQVPDEVLATLSVDDREAMWARTAARDDQYLWVAEREGRILGFASSGPCGDDDADTATGQVYAIYLLPEAIGAGIGRALFARATDDLWAHGYRRATLWVLASNARARRFYEMAGWRADGATQTDEVRGAPLEEVRYAIDLRAAPVTGPPPAS